MLKLPLYLFQRTCSMTTSDKIAELLAGNSQLTYVELGRLCGVSKQRAEQIVKKRGLHKTRRKTSRPCLGGCGKQLFYTVNKSGWCKDCRNLDHVHYVYQCAFCGTSHHLTGGAANRRLKQQKIKATKQFCNGSCRSRFFLGNYWKKRNQ